MIFVELFLHEILKIERVRALYDYQYTLKCLRVFSVFIYLFGIHFLGPDLIGCGKTPINRQKFTQKLAAEFPLLSASISPASNFRKTFS